MMRVRIPRVLGPLVLLAVLIVPHPGAQTDVEPGDQPGAVEQLVEEASQAEATEIRSEEAKVGQRARAVLGAVDDFGGMRVTVEAGIVGLAGSAPSREAVERAVATLRQLDGVLLVVDDVEIERGLRTRLAESWKAVGEQLRGLLAMLPLLGVALAIVVASWFLARLLRDTDWLYRFSRERSLLQALVRQTVFVTVMLAGLVAALRFVDAGAVIGTILGAAGVLGIALGFAFRNIVENYLAGILLAIRQPFRARDVVGIDGQLGTVLRMTSSETTLMDADGNHVRLPNAMIFNGKVVNYTRNPLRRFTLAVSVGNGVGLDRAQELGVQTLRAMKGVIDDPDPSARIAALGDSTVLLEFYGWVDQRAASYAKVASEAQRAVKEAFDGAGIDMPPPEYALRFDTPVPPLPATPGPPAREPVRVEPDTAEEHDLSPESDIDEQVAADLARSDEKNLLEETEPYVGT